MSELDDKLKEIAEDLFMRGVGSAGLEDIEDAEERDMALLNLQTHYSAEAITQIKQAFAAAVMPNVNKMVEVSQKMLNEAMVPTGGRYGIDENGKPFGPTEEL